jgi:hypothetical protein
MIDFESAWLRIKSHAGDEFTQISGRRFRYEAGENFIKPDRTNQNIGRSQFEKAFHFVPLESTTKIQHLRGPSYLYAILMDTRIRQSDW